MAGALDAARAPEELRDVVGRLVQSKLEIELIEDLRIDFVAAPGRSSRKWAYVEA